MPRVARQSAAKLGQILEYMDGPQAVLLERSADNKIVAVAIDREGCDNPFFGAAISYDQWERYRRGVLDLRFLFMYPRWKEWYTFDLKSGKADSIRLTRVPRDSFAESNYIPESGFFPTTIPSRCWLQRPMVSRRKSMLPMGFGISQTSQNFITKSMIYMCSFCHSKSIRSPTNH